MKREEISRGTTDQSNRATVRRDRRGYYSEKTMSEPQIVCTQKWSLKILLPLFL